MSDDGHDISEATEYAKFFQRTTAWAMTWRIWSREAIKVE